MMLGKLAELCDTHSLAQSKQSVSAMLPSQLSSAQSANGPFPPSDRGVLWPLGQLGGADPYNVAIDGFEADEEELAKRVDEAFEGRKSDIRSPLGTTQETDSNEDGDEDDDEDDEDDNDEDEGTENVGADVDDDDDDDEEENDEEVPDSEEDSGEREGMEIREDARRSARFRNRSGRVTESPELALSRDPLSDPKLKAALRKRRDTQARLQALMGPSPLFLDSNELIRGPEVMLRKHSSRDKQERHSFHRSPLDDAILKSPVENEQDYWEFLSEDEQDVYRDVLAVLLFPCARFASREHLNSFFIFRGDIDMHDMVTAGHESYNIELVRRSFKVGRERHAAIVRQVESQFETIYRDHQKRTMQEKAFHSLDPESINRVFGSGKKDAESRDRQQSSKNPVVKGLRNLVRGLGKRGKMKQSDEDEQGDAVSAIDSSVLREEDEFILASDEEEMKGGKDLSAGRERWSLHSQDKSRRNPSVVEDEEFEDLDDIEGRRPIRSVSERIGDTSSQSSYTSAGRDSVSGSSLKLTRVSKEGLLRSSISVVEQKISILKDAQQSAAASEGPDWKLHSPLASTDVNARVNAPQLEETYEMKRERHLKTIAAVKRKDATIQQSRSAGSERSLLTGSSFLSADSFDSTYVFESMIQSRMLWAEIFHAQLLRLKRMRQWRNPERKSGIPPGAFATIIKSSNDVPIHVSREPASGSKGSSGAFHVGHLYVHVPEARNLLGKNADGSSDPYVEIVLQKLRDPDQFRGKSADIEKTVSQDGVWKTIAKCRTCTVRSNLCPSWEHDHYVFDVLSSDLSHQKLQPSQEYVVRLQFKVWNGSRNSFLGQCSRIVPIQFKVRTTGPHDEVQLLQKRSKRSHVQGAVKLISMFLALPGLAGGQEFRTDRDAVSTQESKRDREQRAMKDIQSKSHAYTQDYRMMLPSTFLFDDAIKNLEVLTDKLLSYETFMNALAAQRLPEDLGMYMAAALSPLSLRILVEYCVNRDIDPLVAQVVLAERTLLFIRENAEKIRKTGKTAQWPILELKRMIESLFTGHSNAFYEHHRGLRKLRLDTIGVAIDVFSYLLGSYSVFVMTVTDFGFLVRMVSYLRGLPEAAVVRPHTARCEEYLAELLQPTATSILAGVIVPLKTRKLGDISAELLRSVVHHATERFTHDFLRYGALSVSSIPLFPILGRMLAHSLRYVLLHVFEALHRERSRQSLGAGTNNTVAESTVPTSCRMGIPSHGGKRNDEEVENALLLCVELHKFQDAVSRFDVFRAKPDVPGEDPLAGAYLVKPRQSTSSSTLFHSVSRGSITSIESFTDLQRLLCDSVTLSKPAFRLPLREIFQIDVHMLFDRIHEQALPVTRLLITSTDASHLLFFTLLDDIHAVLERICNGKHHACILDGEVRVFRGIIAQFAEALGAECNLRITNMRSVWSPFDVYRTSKEKTESKSEDEEEALLFMKRVFKRCEALNETQEMWASFAEELEEMKKMSETEELPSKMVLDNEYDAWIKNHCNIEKIISEACSDILESFGSYVSRSYTAILIALALGFPVPSTVLNKSLFVSSRDIDLVGVLSGMITGATQSFSSSGSAGKNGKGNGGGGGKNAVEGSARLLRDRLSPLEEASARVFARILFVYMTKLCTVIEQCCPKFANNLKKALWDRTEQDTVSLILGNGCNGLWGPERSMRASAVSSYLAFCLIQPTIGLRDCMALQRDVRYFEDHSKDSRQGVAENDTDDLRSTVSSSSRLSRDLLTEEFIERWTVARLINGPSSIPSSSGSNNNHGANNNLDGSRGSGGSAKEDHSDDAADLPSPDPGAFLSLDDIRPWFMAARRFYALACSPSAVLVSIVASSNPQDAVQNGNPSEPVRVALQNDSQDSFRQEQFDSLLLLTARGHEIPLPKSVYGMEHAFAKARRGFPLSSASSEHGTKRRSFNPFASCGGSSAESSYKKRVEEEHKVAKRAMREWASSPQIVEARKMLEEYRRSL
eukprot:ANDGO_07655.mRNA.1 hypothetical protein